MVEAIDLPKKTSYLCVKMYYVTAAGFAVERYTDWAEDVDFDEQLGGGPFTFESCPTLAVKLPEYTGVMSEEKAEINLPLSTLQTRISDGMPCAPITCYIWEVILSDDGDDVVLLHFRGRVSVTTRNPEGIPDRVKSEMTNWKAKLSMAMGLPANPTCAWALGDRSSDTNVAGKNCRLNIFSLVQTGTLTVIDKKKVTITGLTTPGGAPGVNYWHRGAVKVGGLRIQIRIWVNASATEFHLVKQPPAEWAGASVKVIPGCDKTLPTCVTRWNNEANFMGHGHAIPSRNPTLELP